MKDRLLACGEALILSRRALDLLDAVGETAVAVHLQHAIDVMSGRSAPSTIEEAEAAMDEPEARAILGRLR